MARNHQGGHALTCECGGQLDFVPVEFATKSVVDLLHVSGIGTPIERRTVRVVPFAGILTFQKVEELKLIQRRASGVPVERFLDGKDGIHWRVFKKGGRRWSGPYATSRFVFGGLPPPGGRGQPPEGRAVRGCFAPPI